MKGCGISRNTGLAERHWKNFSCSGDLLVELWASILARIIVCILLHGTKGLSDVM